MKLKKTIQVTQPERGLRNLVGAQKAGSRGQNSDTIRVNGTYLPTDHSHPGNFFGIIACIIAIIASSGMALSLFLPSLGSPWAYFLGGLMAIHGFAMIADGTGSTQMPAVSHSIKLFWATSASLFIVGFILNVF